MRRLLMIPAVACAFALSACATSEPTQEPASAPTTAPAAPRTELAGTSWRLETLGGAPPVEGHSPTLAFGTDFRVSGTTGCNRYFGGYSPSTGSFGDIGSTRMACAPPLMTQEQTYLGVLGSATSVMVGGDGLLTIVGSDGRRAIFAPATTGS